MSGLSAAEVLALMQRQVPEMVRRAIQPPVKRFATVQLLDPGGLRAVVLVDGDTTPIEVVNAAGYVEDGSRIVVDFYHPHGAIASAPLGLQAVAPSGAWFWNVAAFATTGTAGSGVLTSPTAQETSSPPIPETSIVGNTVVLGRGGLYWLMISGGFGSSNAGTTRAMRLDASVGGNGLLAFLPAFTNTSGFGANGGNGRLYRIPDGGEAFSITARQDTGGNVAANCRLSAVLLDA